MQYYPQQRPSMMYNGGMSSYIPSYPIGNIAPLGYGGYGGYYTGDYNRYNPYYIQQQHEIQLAQQRESQRVENDIFKKLAKASSTYLGYELTEEDLSKFDVEEDPTADLTFEEKETYSKLQMREQYMQYHQQKILEMQGNSVPAMSAIGYAYAKAYNDMHDRAKREIPDTVGLVEYTRKYAGKKYMEALEADQKKSQCDLTRLYNREGYNDLIKRHRSSLFGNTVFDPDANIDDQEIRLPNLISEKTRQERRKQFLDAILKGGAM